MAAHDCGVIFFKTLAVLSLALGHLPEDRVSWRLPLDVKLLGVDDFVRVHDLLNDFFRLLFVHFPDLLKAVVVRFLEPLKLLL